MISYESDWNSYLALLLMSTIPLLAANNAINQRQMRELNEYTVGAYLQVSILLAISPLSKIIHG